ncbi:MAG: F0F1 ATP synthase subunit B [Bacteroidota bacterium]
MQLITPDLGAIFWMVIVFGLLLYILGKYAWKPIVDALKQREYSIESALNAAEKAREDISKMEAKHEKILEQAKEERDTLLKEAREMKSQLITEAKENAGEEAKKIISAARASMENEKVALLNDIRKQVASFSVEIAEKILRDKLSGDEEQKEMVRKMVKEVKLN